MTTVSPVARRLRTPSWFDARLVLGIALVLASIILGAVVVSRADATEPALVVSHDLAAGTKLTGSDVRIARVKLGRTRAGYLARPADAVGQRLTRPVGSGELLARAALGDPTPGDTTVPISVAPDNAPALARGQRVAVWVSTAYCTAVQVIGDVTVQSVRNAGSGLSSSSDESVVVQVSPPLATRIFSALGLPGAVIRVGVLGGTPDPLANRSLPELGSCAKAPGS